MTTGSMPSRRQVRHVGRSGTEKQRQEDMEPSGLGLHPRPFHREPLGAVATDAEGDADAVLKATVLSASANPLVYDSTTGRAVSALVTVSVQVTLTDRQGKVLFENPSYLFHDQYEISRDLPSFFQEDSPAVDRLSQDFARTLVANILEAY